LAGREYSADHSARGHSCPRQHGISAAIENFNASDQSRIAADRNVRAPSWLRLCRAVFSCGYSVWLRRKPRQVYPRSSAVNLFSRMNALQQLSTSVNN